MAFSLMGLKRNVGAKGVKRIILKKWHDVSFVLCIIHFAVISCTLSLKLYKSFFWNCFTESYVEQKYLKLRNCLDE